MNNDWINRYWQLIIDKNFEEAIPLKALNFPDTFFKYRRLTETTIETLKENYIWLAEISSLNDPFECSIQFDNDECLRKYYASTPFRQSFKSMTGHTLTEKEIKLLTTSLKPHDEYIKICRSRDIPYSLSSDQQLNRVQQRWNKIVEQTSQNLRVCSFSLNKNSLLLWSHYAEEHKGVCIEYDFVDVNVVRTFIQPVLYSEKVYKIGLFEEYTIMQLIASSLIKAKDWSYEQEWRLTIFKQANNFPHKISVPIPKAIYLGTRFNVNEEPLKMELYKIAQEKKIPLLQMTKHPNEFKLIEE